MSAPLDALHRRPAEEVVLRDVDGPLRVADLRARIERWSGELRRMAGACVASRLDNGRDALTLDLAARAAGIPHVPLPPFFSPSQLDGALARCGADLLLQTQGLPTPPGWHAAGKSGSHGRWLQRELEARVVVPAGTDCITFTSGSTGEPRGVCLSASLLDTVAGSLAWATHSLRLRRHLCVLPLSTLLEQVAGIYAALQAEAEILLPPLSELGYSGAAGLDPQRLLDCIARHRPESLILLPQLLLALVTAAESGARLPDSLRFIAVGGARVGTGLLARAARVGLPVYEGYGLSECGSVVCLNRPGEERHGSVGRPLAHVQVQAGADGELFVSGARMLGYLGDATPAIDPLPTGDLGRIDADGFVHVEGRRKNLFITSFGRNVSPEWVETELLQHPLIAQAVVFGEARPFNVAVIVPRGAGVGEAELMQALRSVNAGLPDYARVARGVLAPHAFTAADGMMTANGRPRREAIARRFAAELDALYESHPVLEGALIP